MSQDAATEPLPAAKAPYTERGAPATVIMLACGESTLRLHLLKPVSIWPWPL